MTAVGMVCFKADYTKRSSIGRISVFASIMTVRTYELATLIEHSADILELFTRGAVARLLAAGGSDIS